MMVNSSLRLARTRDGTSQEFSERVVDGYVSMNSIAEVSTMTNDDQSPEKRPPADPKTKDTRLKTLFDLERAHLTPEQLEELEAERRGRGEAQWASMYQWTDHDVHQYLAAFEAQRPDQHAEYIRQERLVGEIDGDLATEMRRFAQSIFPNVTLIDRTNLFIHVRRHVRASLNLSW